MNTRIDWTTLNNQQRTEQQIGILPPHLTVRQPWCVHDAVFDQTNVLELLICRSRPRTHLYPHPFTHVKATQESSLRQTSQQRLDNPRNKTSVSEVLVFGKWNNSTLDTSMLHAFCVHVLIPPRHCFFVQLFFHTLISHRHFKTIYSDQLSVRTCK